MDGSGPPNGVPRVPLSGDDARSGSADTNSSATYRPASSGSGGGVTPELVLVDPELALAQRLTKLRKAAMSSTEPANTFPDPAQRAPLQETAQPSMRDVPLGTLIFRAGLLGEEQLEDALQEGMRTGKRLGEVLLERGWLNERDLGRMLAGQKGLPFVDVSVSDAEPDALEALDEEDARRQVALPLFYEDGKLVIAVGDPSNELVLESLRRELEAEFQLVVAPHAQLRQVIDEAYSLPASDPAPPSARRGLALPGFAPRGSGRVTCRDGARAGAGSRVHTRGRARAPGRGRSGDRAGARVGGHDSALLRLDTNAALENALPERAARLPGRLDCTCRGRSGA